MKKENPNFRFPRLVVFFLVTRVGNLSRIVFAVEVVFVIGVNQPSNAAAIALGSATAAAALV